eukprot:COSAG02_NODE_39469_length_416_cov_223.917981_1_plen_68_part_01
MRMAVLVCLAASTLAAGAPPSPRTRSKFDLGWKFHLGNPPKTPSSCNSSTFPINLSHVQCLDLVEQRG